MYERIIVVLTVCCQSHPYMNERDINLLVCLLLVPIMKMADFNCGGVRSLINLLLFQLQASFQTK